MTLQSNIQWPERLVTFCQGVVSKYAASGPPSEEKLADEFVSFFGIESVGTFEASARFSEELGIKVSTSSLPKELKGYHHCFGDHREIFIGESDAIYLTREHTLLHELREILEHVFRDLGFPTTMVESLERRAEEFAVSVEMRARTEFLRTVFKGIQKVESKWKRRVGYALFAIFGVIFLFSVPMTPLLEDQILDRA